jgi:hypothetical protein
MGVLRYMRSPIQQVWELREMDLSTVRSYRTEYPFGEIEWIVVRLMRPLVLIALPDTRFTHLDWANSEVVALGCSNGMSGDEKLRMSRYAEPNGKTGHVAVYNLKSPIQGKEDPQG